MFHGLDRKDPTHPAEAPWTPRPEQIADALQAGRGAADWAFDYFLSSRARALSSQHWTPIAVAARAAQWFDECRVRTVLDIGSGAGKFCITAALAGRCHFTGLEHRADLVAGARALARTFSLEHRVHFLEGALGTLSIPVVDAYYLYNPFEENVAQYSGRIDEEVELNESRYARDLASVGALLSSARVGTYVLIYNGFGGTLPARYLEVRADRELPNVLRLWRKVGSRGVERIPISRGSRSDGTRSQLVAHHAAG